ncbi:hypothetical protein PILCRDRAFT_568245 [Piloderma croceum F 1598]|uniref:Uncharacterized protein n=1 Tax=Piloderma croceum (strain F 1598) TaxID=765440 RepID=A0A0C3BPC5_PILCF|nr:hypothetical protein PILCRDRAFT_568245 [Piloderma croceum F 1598]
MNASCGNASVRRVILFGQLGHVRSYSVFGTALGMTELPTNATRVLCHSYHFLQYHLILPSDLGIR